MKFYKDTADGDRIYAYEDDVTVTMTGGASIVTVTRSNDEEGNPILTTLSAPTTLVPTTQPPSATPVTSPADLAQAALMGGITIASATAPSLNGTYSCDPDTLSNIQAEMIALLDNGQFTNDAETLAWPDIVGTFHDFSPTQFRAYARAVAKFVGGCKTIMIAGAGLVPPATAELP